MRPPLLFMTHRVPYPPNKGDKIRNYHVLNALARRYDVHLLSFAEPGEGPSPVLAERCASVGLIPAPSGRLPSLGRALLGGVSVSEAHYRSQAMAQAINALVAQHDIKDFWVGSSALAPYLMARDGRRFADFMDVDSDKWRQYADSAGNPLARWIYRREARLVEALENQAIKTLDGVFVVAKGERDLLQKRLGTCDNVVVAGNGVADVSPGSQPQEQRPEEVIFLGAMDYRPNVDAVCWFAEQVWPQVRQARPDARFLVIGSNPASPVSDLAQLPGVEVTGTVPEVLPYLHRAQVMVAPLRIARGIQNKVLEGMAAGLPVVTTPEGADGLDAEDGKHFLVRSAPDTMADEVIQLLANPEAAAALGARAQHLVENAYGWDSRLRPLMDVMSPQACADPTSLAEATG